MDGADAAMGLQPAFVALASVGSIVADSNPLRRRNRPVTPPVSAETLPSPWPRSDLQRIAAHRKPLLMWSENPKSPACTARSRCTGQAIIPKPTWRVVNGGAQRSTTIALGRGWRSFCGINRQRLRLSHFATKQRVLLGRRCRVKKSTQCLMINRRPSIT
jgi:hypothetical protein